MKHISTEILNLLLDEQLTSDERVNVQAHIAECAECRAELAVQRRIFTTLDTLADEPIPADLAPRVLAQIESTQRVRWAEALIVVELVAAIALAVWLGEIIMPLVDWLPDFGAAMLAFQQVVIDALNAIPIGPLEENITTEWRIISTVAVVTWSLTNWWLIHFPKQKEVFV